MRRVEIGLSQSELGEKLGVSFQQVQKYENGVNRVGASRLQQITEALGVDMTFFYEGNSKAEREVDSLLFLDSSFTLRLLRAYTAVENKAVQRQFVWLKALWLHRVKQTAHAAKRGLQHYRMHYGLKSDITPCPKNPCHFRHSMDSE